MACPTSAVSRGWGGVLTLPRVVEQASFEDDRGVTTHVLRTPPLPELAALRSKSVQVHRTAMLHVPEGEVGSGYLGLFWVTYTRMCPRPRVIMLPGRLGAHSKESQQFVRGSGGVRAACTARASWGQRPCRWKGTPVRTVVSLVYAVACLNADDICETAHPDTFGRSRYDFGLMLLWSRDDTEYTKVGVRSSEW